MVEKTTGQVAVTQDILLIPRTVYVPYAPQVPVAPARLGTVAPAERMITQQQTTREAVPDPRAAELPRTEPTRTREAAPPCDKSTEALDKCCQMLERLERRIDDLEKKTQPCPPIEVPCPVDGPVPYLPSGPEPCPPALPSH
jgi:hypothetical protein